MRLFNCEASFNNFQELGNWDWDKLGLFLATGKSQMLYLSIKKVTRNCCKIIVQSHCCQYVVKFLKELSSTQCLNFLKKIIFSVHNNPDSVHLTHVKASYDPLFMTSMLILIKFLPLSILEYQEIS